VSPKGILSDENPMVGDLGNLSVDIASLSKLLAAAEGTNAAWLIEQLVHHLQSALEQLMERPGMLAEPAPWWMDWQNNAPAR
jgi:hypothetical protein